MRFFVALSALVYVCNVCDARPSNAVPRSGFGSFIMGGTDVSAGEFPWQLSLQRATVHVCGAVMLGTNGALTAAHCVDGVDPANLRVLAGTIDRTQTTGTDVVVSQVFSYIKHMDYTGVGNPRNNHDIALLYLATSISYGVNSFPAKLPSDNTNLFVGVTVIITGWGRTQSGNNLPNGLMKGSIPVISQADCNARQDAESTGYTTGPGQICVQGILNNIGTCTADSGGPMNYQSPTLGWIVIGVASWEAQFAGTCLPTLPSVYTRIGYYLDWIKSNCKDDYCCYCCYNSC